MTLQKLIYKSLSRKTKMKLLKNNAGIITTAALGYLVKSKKNSLITGLVLAGMTAGIVALAKR